MTETRANRSIPLLLWPFYALWRLLTFVLEVTGRIICAVMGLALMAVGVMLSISVIGAPVGVPLAVLGFLLLLRAVF